MNSRVRFDNNNSFMFYASNISWHIIMKARITITAFDQDKNEAKGEKKQKKRNLTRTWLVQRANSKNISLLRGRSWPPNKLFFTS